MRKWKEKGHTALRMVHLTSSDNYFPLTGNITLARNASGSLHRGTQDLKKISKLFFYRWYRDLLEFI